MDPQNWTTRDVKLIEDHFRIPRSLETCIGARFKGAKHGKALTNARGPSGPAFGVHHIDRWNELRVRAQKGNFWQAYDKFKAIRLMGRQPLDVLEDTTGDLLTMFLASHTLYPVNRSPFSELRCEVADDQYPTVRRRLEQLSVDLDQGMPTGDAAAICILEDLIDWHTQPLEQLALKHKARTEAEAAEATRRLAFDPGAAADKVRRYEDASIRRMTRACDDLAKLRRSGMFDEDWPAACEAETIETGAPLDESGWSTAVPASDTTSGGWGRRPEGDAPRSEASALGARRLSPARPPPPISCHPQRPTWNRAPQRPRRHPKPRSTNYRPRSTQTGPGRAKTPTTSRTHRKKDRVRERPRRHPKPQSTVHARRSTVTRGGGMHCRSRLVFGYASTRKKNRDFSLNGTTQTPSPWPSPPWGGENWKSAPPFLFPSP